MTTNSNAGRSNGVWVRLTLYRLDVHSSGMCMTTKAAPCCGSVQAMAHQSPVNSRTPYPSGAPRSRLPIGLELIQHIGIGT